MQMNQTFRFTKAVFYQLGPIPMYEPFQDATQPEPVTTVDGACYLKLYDQDGTVGVGSASRTLVDKFLPLLLTGKQENYEDLYQRLFWAYRNDGFSGPTYGALGALDTILIDLMSRRAGLPMHRFLGAQRDWVYAYASGHSCHKSMDELEAEALDWKSRGYTMYKMKVGTRYGTQIERDVQRVKLVRQVIGPEARLAIDANQLWNANDAMRFFEKVEPYDIYWYEEPVHSHDLVELEKLCKMCPVMVAMGESLRNHYFFKAYIDAGVRHLQANPPLMGWRDWSQVRDMAKAHGLMFSANGNVSTTFLATCCEATPQEYLRPRRLPVLDLMRKRPLEKDGKFFLPDEPGVCLEPDWALLEARGLLKTVQYFYAK